MRKAEGDILRLFLCSVCSSARNFAEGQMRFYPQIFFATTFFDIGSMSTAENLSGEA